ncbi:DUF4181 domain-containing protein [Psychrobacillus sp. OK028]|uniref:DUF4181 domain-containing protein n=1 Tax=Psychrobacillus sp. OK028 TaxID=1884359 RepID=UPI000B844412|nr:DUF4181 domain-containing protein [Psychrobacillus sp. OK028]
MGGGHLIWVNFAFIVLVVLVLNTFFKLLFRKSFNIEKEQGSFFSNKHFNEWHRKIDWGIRFTSFIAFIFTTNLIFIEGYSINVLLITSFCYIGIDYVVRAFFERKFARNTKQYILTISEGVIIMLALLIVFKFDLLV